MFWFFVKFFFSKDHSKQRFIDHAYEIHPEAIDDLSAVQDGSLSDILLPWKEIKKEEPSEEYFEYSLDLDQDIDLDQGLDQGLDQDMDYSYENDEPTNTQMKPTYDIDGEKKYTCLQCPKDFATPSKLKRHVSQVHECVKSHQCDKCDKAFGQKDKLKRHILTGMF